MSSGHRLAPLLAPGSIAYVGASARTGTPGNNVLRMNRRGGYGGRVYPVNPNYREIEGLACYPALAALPEAPDLVVLVVADHRLEAVLAEAIACGARAALVFGGANLAEDRDPPLPARLAAMARAAGLVLCGGNCMGFFNMDRGVRATFVWPPYDTRTGAMTLISHSGSSWSSLTLNDERLGYNLAISAGQELTVTVADYLDYALGLETTRAVGLILETVRDPAAFLAALETAAMRGVPIVALTVGRTAESARLALGHSGALAGDDAAYEAVFDRYGVAHVRTLEELAATMSLLAQPRRAGPGGLAASHDSGFERELLVDLAAELGVPLARMAPATVDRLAGLLDPGLEPTNPVDAWGTGRDYERIFTETFCALLADPATALGVVSHSPRTGADITEAWVEVAIEATRRTKKPVAMITNFPWTHHREVVAALTVADVPVIEGMANGLKAVRHAFAYRDFSARPARVTPPGPGGVVTARWRARLATAAPLDEAEALSLLVAYGIPAIPNRLAVDAAGARAAAAALGYPVALKTAMPGTAHKTEVGGVQLGLADEPALAAAYADLADRLGPRALVAAMAPAGGVEMALGLVADAQFGPLVLIGAGGVLIEHLSDRRLALPPLDAAEANRHLDRLAVRPLLDGHRGRPAADLAAFAQAAARLSILAAELGDLIAALDVNPVIVGPAGCVAVDALVVPRAAAG